MKASEEFIKGKHNIGWVDSAFTSNFGSDTFQMGSALKSHTLTRSMSDSEIIKEFGIQECTFGDILATLKDASEDMKDGYANIFYVKDHPSRVVDVNWNDGEWFVRDWYRGDGRWYEGRRVFTPATGALNNRSMDLESLTLENAIKICKENGLEVTKHY